MQVEEGTKTNNISKVCPRNAYLQKLIEFAKEKGCPWVINNPDGIKDLLSIFKGESEHPKGESEDPKGESEDPKGESEDPKGESEDPKKDSEEGSDNKLKIRTENKSYAAVLTNDIASPDIIQGRQSPFSSHLSGRGTPSPFTFNNLDENPDKEKEKKNHEFANEYFVTVSETRDENLSELKLYTVFSNLPPDKFDEIFVKAYNSSKLSISIEQVDGSIIRNVQVPRGWKLKQEKIKFIGTDKWVDNPKKFYGYEKLEFTYTKCNKRWKAEYTCMITNREGKKDKIILNESKVDNKELSKNKKVSQELYDLDNLFNKATKDGNKYVNIDTKRGMKEAQVHKGWIVKEIKYIEICPKSKVDKVEKKTKSESSFSALANLENESVNEN